MLNQELQKIEKDNSGPPEFTKDDQRQRFLENEIHKTTLKMMEADMVRKKYDVILDMLKQERLSYMSQIEELESVKRKQAQEVFMSFLTSDSFSAFLKNEDNILNLQNQ